MVMPVDRRLEAHEGLELVRKAREQTSLVIFANISDPGTDIDKWCALAMQFEQATSVGRAFQGWGNDHELDGGHNILSRFPARTRTQARATDRSKSR